ncbi:hypothetical protein [Ruegeria sp. MALMAid1280]|uniref:hypothetical protein n=1 Tax=Ruegeria sp. MALMAid1280 TaxID=3411634 RepID=UPI003BA112E7
MKTTTLLFATVLSLTGLTCLIIGFATYQSAGTVNWQLIQIVSAIGLAMPILAWLWVWLFNVFLPLFLWVFWKYLSLFEWILGIKLGTWFGKQILGDPMAKHSERGKWPFLHREVAQALERERAYD